MGAGFQYPLGVVSLANCADAPISDDPISFIIDIRVHHNKQELGDLQPVPLAAGEAHIQLSTRASRLANPDW